MVIRPKLCAGSYGILLADFKQSSLSITEMDKAIEDHNFTQESLEETFRLLKTLKNYDFKKKYPSIITHEKRQEETQ